MTEADTRRDRVPAFLFALVSPPILDLENEHE
jgi:hypothetical protein